MKKIMEVLKERMMARFTAGNHVKMHCGPAKGILALLAAAWLLAAVPPLAVSAAAGAQLAVEKQTVSITLKKPEEELYAVNALRFRMYVTVHAGNMEQPAFEFAADGDDIVRSAKVSATEDGRYLVDVILSSKNSSDIFINGQAVIGSLILHSAGSEAMQATVEVAHETTSEGVQPAVRYVNSVSQSVQVVPIAGAQPVTVTDSGASTQTPPAPIIPDQPSSPVIPSTPGVPGTPNTPVLPGKPDPDTNKPAEPDQPGSTDTEKDPDNNTGESDFQKKAAPDLKVSTKKGTKRVSFQWNEIAGADGYQIYQYQEDTGKYKRLKTIFQGQATGYTKKMEYGTTYKFKLRAFQKEEDGTKIKGAFSKAASITTAPDKVKSFTIKTKADGVTLSWKQTGGADGYKIYQCTKKNGKYTRIKTIKKGTKHKYVIPDETTGKVYYKVRAYVIGADGKNVYGEYSSIRRYN